MLNTTRRRAGQTGLSLVELMVGIAIGLVVVAGAVLVTTGQLGDNRRLLLETQLQQDLRATADIIARELRRAGSTNAGQAAVWSPGSAGAQPNAFATISPSVSPASQTDFSYRRGPGAVGPYGFKLEGNVIRTLLAAAGWQDLTDGNTMRVTAFAVTPQIGPEARLPCPAACADGTSNCWPSVTVRDYRVQITAQAVVDASVVRQIDSLVRVRNDWVRFNDPAAPTTFCPA